MSQMTAVQVSGPGGAFETVNRQLPEPGPQTVRIKIEACGVCHSDVFVKEGHWPGLQYPRVTGHEVAGVIDAVGPGVTIWKKGQRVGVGWHGGHCGQCVSCRRGDFMGCQNFQVTGFQEDGGYAQYMIARSEAVAAIPDALSPVEAAPHPLRRRHDLQQLAPQRGEGRRSRGGAWIGWTWASGHPVRQQDGLSHRGDRAGPRQGSLGVEARCCRYLDTDQTNAARRIDQDGRRLGHSGDRAEQQSDVGVDRWTCGRWQAAGCGGISRPHYCHAHSTHRRSPIDSRLAIRNRPGFRRHTELLCADRHSSHGRDLPARTSRCRLRSHAERQGAISSGAYDG